MESGVLEGRVFKYSINTHEFMPGTYNFQFKAKIFDE